MRYAVDDRDTWWGLKKSRQAAQVVATVHECEEHTPSESVIAAGVDELPAVDKPPFLPVTPNGRTVANTMRGRLRCNSGESEIAAVHRLGLLANGLLLFFRNPATRTCYQQLFQNQEITREYKCLIVIPDDWRVGEAKDVTLLLDSNLARCGIKVVETNVSARVATKDPKLKLARITVISLGPAATDTGNVLANSHSGGSGGGATSASIPLHAISCGYEHHGSNMQVGHWRLQSYTGRAYQLRVTMDWLGYPTLGEDTYGREAGAQGSSASASNVSTYTPQPRLIATALTFANPVTGE